MKFSTVFSIPPMPVPMLLGLMIVGISMIDSSLMGRYLSSLAARSSVSILGVFAAFFLVYAIGQYFILAFIKKKNILNPAARKKGFNVLEFMVIIAQCGMMAVILIIILQMTFTRAYNIFLFDSVIYISYTLSIVLLGVLVQRLVSWYRFNHNLVILTYAVAISLFLVSEGFAVTKLGIEVADDPIFISAARNPWDAYSSADRLFDYGFSISVILSFITTWVATVLLMHNYSRKIGRVKYWILVAVPLIYFLGPSEIIIMNSFGSGGVFASLLNTIFFIGTKQGAGILFAIAFWTIATNIESEKIKYYMTLSALGVMLLFSSNQIAILKIAPYPPFGIATLSLAVLSAFLILLGLFYSAVSVSQDAKLRQSIKKSTREQAKLLNALGSYETQRSIEKMVVKISSESTLIKEKETEAPSSLEKDDIKEYVKEVMDELKREYH
jgi:hypothetical protein